MNNVISMADLRLRRILSAKQGARLSAMQVLEVFNARIKNPAILASYVVFTEDPEGCIGKPVKFQAVDWTSDDPEDYDDGVTPLHDIDIKYMLDDKHTIHLMLHGKDAEETGEYPYHNANQHSPSIFDRKDSELFKHLRINQLIKLQSMLDESCASTLYYDSTQDRVVMRFDNYEDCFVEIRLITR